MRRSVCGLGAVFGSQVHEQPVGSIAYVAREYPHDESAGFHAAGVPLLTGTDVGIPVILAGSSLHDELQEFVNAGLEPAAALRSATSVAAEFLGRDDTGAIAAGNVADLVLLRAKSRLAETSWSRGRKTWLRR